MGFDLQKATITKRVAAFLLDFILLSVLVTGLVWGFSELFKYQECIDNLNAIYDKYAAEYNIDLDSVQELSQEELKQLTDAMDSDENAIVALNLLVNLTLVIASLSLLISYIILEFIVPKIFGNGQTIGKKIFSIGIMRVDGVKLSTVSLFVRTILGKFTFETMVPLLLIIFMFIFGASIVNLVVLALIAILQIVVVIATKTNSAIHDLMAQTVAVDLSSQRIFNSEAELLEYKKSLHAESTERSTY